MKVEINNWQNRGYLVSSGGGEREGLVIHGYGSNSGEMLGLAVGLAEEMPLKLLVFDLPGHGAAAAAPLTLAAACKSLDEAAAALENLSFFIGHSLGARVGLLSGVARAVCISLPGKTRFEGSRSDLLRHLRARRVNEASPLGGLTEILAAAVEPAEKTLLLRAGHELESVKALAAEWENRGIDCHKIIDSNHNDIVSSPETRGVIAAWLKQN